MLFDTCMLFMACPGACLSEYARYSLAIAFLLIHFCNMRWSMLTLLMATVHTS